VRHTVKSPQGTWIEFIDAVELSFRFQCFSRRLLKRACDDGPGPSDRLYSWSRIQRKAPRLGTRENRPPTMIAVVPQAARSYPTARTGNPRFRPAQSGIVLKMVTHHDPLPSRANR
jgi:hypothetical protein